MSAEKPPDPEVTVHDPAPNTARPRSRHTPPARIASPDSVPVTVPSALTRVKVPVNVSAAVWVAVFVPRVRLRTTVDEESGELTPRLVAETAAELAKVQFVVPPAEVSSSDRIPDDDWGEVAEIVDDSVNRLTANSGNETVELTGPASETALLEAVFATPTETATQTGLPLPGLLVIPSASDTYRPRVMTSADADVVAPATRSQRAPEYPALSTQTRSAPLPGETPAGSSKTGLMSSRVTKAPSSRGDRSVFAEADPPDTSRDTASTCPSATEVAPPNTIANPGAKHPEAAATLVHQLSDGSKADPKRPSTLAGRLGPPAGTNRTGTAS